MSIKRISGRETLVKPSKRRKLETSPLSADSTPKEIKSAHDLKALLFFDQGSISSLHKNIYGFQEYVKLLNGGNVTLAPVKTTLLQFLQSGSSSKNQSASSALAPLFQCWSYAAQTENDQLLRTIPGALAALLSTISWDIDFRETGLQACKDLLQPEQLGCIERCLKPNRSKAGAIIACLRLLTQIVGFDGGALARKLHREQTVYRQLETLLTMSAGDMEIPDKKKPYHVSIRDCAVRFLLANLRFQSESAKAEIIGQGNMVRNLVRGLENDPPSLVKEVLTVSNQYVLEDSDLTASVKSRFLLDSTLTQVARLYRYAQDEDERHGDEDISALAHEFLLAACVPREPDSTKFREPSTDLNLEPEDLQRTQDKTTSSGVSLVKNKGLLILLSKLRPHASPLQKSLALAIFTAQPHLVHDYFKESTFHFDPKLTATWVGYSSFLLSVVMLPLPTNPVPKANSKHGEALQQNSIRDSILPPSLDRDVLERCLNLHKEPLIVFFATRLLIAAFQKVQAYVTSLQAFPSEFKTASRSIMDWFCQRCPRGRVVIGAYRMVGEASSLQKEQLSRLLLFYYSLAPRLVVDAKFDIGLVVAEALEAAQTKDSGETRDELFQFQLSHLLRIASLSPAMRWWNPPGKSLAYSPFVSVLRAYVLREPRNPEILELLKSILRDNSVLQPKRLDSALGALIQSLEAETDPKTSHYTFEFLDTCFFHLSKHDLKYASMLYELVDKFEMRRAKEADEFSLLSIAIGEQWSFATEREEIETLRHVAQWITRYLEAMDDIGESRTILRSLRDDIIVKTTDGDVQVALQQALPETKRLPILRRQSDTLSSHQNGTNRPSMPNPQSSSTKESLSALRAALDSSLAPYIEPDTHPELTRWRRKDVSDTIDEGIMAQLCTNLSSPHVEVRLQSLSALRSFIPMLQESSLSSQPQLYLLLNELIETASTVRDSALPSFATSLAVSAIPILQQPLHFMYPKVNDFLLQRPAWAVERLPSYWIRAVLQTPPSQTQSGMQSKETAWLIERLIEGVRTAEDVELYRGNGVLERVLARCQIGLASEKVVDNVLKLVYRLTFFEAGSTAFLTRWGGIAWLEGELARCSSEDTSGTKNANQGNGGMGSKNVKAGEDDAPLSRRRLTLLCILDRLVATCDMERLKSWSGGEFEFEKRMDLLRRQ